MSSKTRTGICTTGTEPVPCRRLVFALWIHIAPAATAAAAAPELYSRVPRNTRDGVTFPLCAPHVAAMRGFGECGPVEVIAQPALRFRAAVLTCGCGPRLRLRIATPDGLLPTDRPFEGEGACVGGG